jgi:multidrug efflux system membrane fusion protein
MKKIWVGISLTALLLFSCSKKVEPKKTYVPKVKVATAEVKTIPVYIDGIGHTAAYNSAEIKAQVEGRLLKLHFEEGDEVQEGQLLYTIDPRPYEAQLDQMIAERMQNLAKMQYAAEKVACYQPLLPENFVAKLNYFQYVSDLAFYESAVLENDAEIRLAEINLDYCYIKAPFTGVLGKRLIDVGNLIVNDGKPLIVLNQIDPIFLDFTVPERMVMQLLKKQRQGELDVLIEFPEYKDQLFHAKLVLIDNMINSSTGMIPLRAEISNPDHLFWPGQFIRAKVILAHVENAVLIPEIAINFGQKGQFVYVITDKGIAEVKLIKLGQKQGGFVQVKEGLKGGEKVVTDGQINLLPGVFVEVLGAAAK